MIHTKTHRRNFVLFLRALSLPFNITRKVSKIKSLKLDYFCLSSLIQKCEPQAGFAIEQVKMY